MDSSKQLGDHAEQEACQFLQKKGLKLLERNYSCFLGEIDLIMQDQDDIVFVEVRSRHNTAYGNALESITKSKISKLIKTATHFLQGKQWLYTVNSRFDVIAIHPVAENIELEWIKNAFWTESR